MDGIELSQDMVDRLREKPGGQEVDVAMGDMSRVTSSRSRRAAELLRLLNTYLHRWVHRDQLLEWLWPEQGTPWPRP